MLSAVLYAVVTSFKKKKIVIKMQVSKVTRLVYYLLYFNKLFRLLRFATDELRQYVNLWLFFPLYIPEGLHCGYSSFVYFCLTL